MSHLFTPRRRGGARLRMQISPADRQAVNAAREASSRGWTAKVTDIATGILYSVKAAPCGGGCYCDALVTGTVEPC